VILEALWPLGSLFLKQTRVPATKECNHTTRDISIPPKIFKVNRNVVILLDMLIAGYISGWVSWLPLGLSINTTSVWGKLKNGLLFLL